MFAMKLQVAVAQHRTREQPGFAENLKAIADPEHGAAAAGKFRHAGHDWREPGDGAGAEVIAVREASRQHHHVGPLQGGFLVPDEFRILPEHVPGGMIGVVIAIRSGEDDDAEFHKSVQLPAASFQPQPRRLEPESPESGSYSTSTL